MIGRSEVIQVTHIWEAYRALGRYVYDTTGHGPKGLKPQAQTPQTARYNGRAYAAATRLKTVVGSLWFHTPIADASPTYFSYLYLFSQLLRCSYPHYGFDPGRGWYGLSWFPIWSLLGKTGSGERAWYAFRAANGRHMTVGELMVRYPMYEADIVVSKHAVETEVDQLLQLHTTQQLSIRKIFETLNSHGRVRGPREAIGWHPMLVLSRWEAWSRREMIECFVESHLPHVRAYVDALLSAPRGMDTYGRDFLRLAHPDLTPNPRVYNQALTLIRDGWDGLVPQLTLAAQRNWSKARQRCFPGTGEELLLPA